MKHLLNTLYVLSEDCYLALDGKNVVMKRDGDIVGRYPLHTLEDIIVFTYIGVSPVLMGYCAENGVGLSFCKPNGHFLCRVVGDSHGNVLLRRKQYRVADDGSASLLIARNMIAGKVYNAKWYLGRMKRDHAVALDVDMFEHKMAQMDALLHDIRSCSVIDTLRGLEGSAASLYFDVFDQMILRNKSDFRFSGRNRRPPLDPVNALLSFVYSLLSNNCASALSSVGLDPYVGFMHVDRAGRKSLALDMMEELRPCFADRFVLGLINKGRVSRSDFGFGESGAVLLNDSGRRTVLGAWQEAKKAEIVHPFLAEKIMWGLVPYVQSMLLARYLRGDLDEYPAFLWRC